MEEFEKCIKTGQQLKSNHQPTAAIAEYEIAVNLYQGDYLAEDPYEEWTVLDRERFESLIWILLTASVKFISTRSVMPRVSLYANVS